MIDRSFATLLQHLRQRAGVAADLSDGQLVGHFVAVRDEAAFEALLERHGPMVLRLCRSVLRDEHDAEDAFQATFLVLASKAASIRKQRSVANWLYGVALRVARCARVRAARHPQQALGSNEPMVQPTSDGDLLELRCLLAEELQRLPEKYRAPLVLCYLEGKTNQAAARELGWPGGSMAKRLARGRELLRERLTARGLAVSAGLVLLTAEGTATAAVPASLAGTTLQAVSLFTTGAAAPAATPVALAQGVLRAMSAAKLKLLVLVFLLMALTAGAVGRFAYRGHAADGTDQPAVTLPADPKAVVLRYDVRRPDLPRHAEGPRLRLTADGTVTVLDPYETGRSATARLSGDDLQGLLRFVLREHHFGSLDGAALGKPGRGGVGTLTVQVEADGLRQEVRCADVVHLDAASPDTGHVRAIAARLERLVGWAYAGGKEGVAAALDRANRRLHQDIPKAPPLCADDLQAAGPRAEGSTEVVFERRGVAPDRNPYSFVYARLELPVPGKPRITVKANLAPATSDRERANTKKGPLDVRPRPIAGDPTVKYDYDIVYVRGTRKGDKAFVHWPEIFNPLGMEPGADLMLLHPNGSEERLVSGADGSVTDPFVSFDGEWVYYAKFHNPQPLPANYRGNNYAGSDIYRIHAKTRKIVQLTHQEFTPNTGIVSAEKSLFRGKHKYPVFNLGPCPAPGGKVVFTSNRNGFLPPRAYTRTTLQLFLMDDDGSNVEEVGYLNVGSALHPTILRDGRIMFSSYETQGVRDIRNWGMWTIHPDGTNWGPLVGAFSFGRAFHFQSQLSDGQIVVEEYYNGNNQGWGTYFAFPDQPQKKGYPTFVDATRGSNTPADGGMAFMPVGLVHFTAFSNPHDGPAKLSDPKNPKSLRVGKVTHPSGAPDNHLLTAWTGALPGPSKEYNTAYAVPDSGIYLIKSGRPIDEPGQMLLIKNDPKYNEQWPRALVPYKRIYGIDEPRRLPFANSGKRSRHLPEGTPFGLIGTSSLYKRESFPGGKVQRGSVTAGYFGPKEAPYQGLGSLCDAHGHVNWFYQGSEAGRYDNKDIHAIRVIAFEPKSNGQLLGFPQGQHRKFWNMANERMRILGEFPVRKFTRDPKGSAQPTDPDGNPDTSFLARMPADVPFTFQMLDKNGMVLTMAQTWHQVRPGEVRNNCGGCHAHSQKPTEFHLTAAAKPDYPVWDLTTRTPLLAARKADQSGKQWDADNETGVRYVHGPLNVEYYRDIKPIFDRSCVACHTGKSGKPAGKLVLDDDRLMAVGNGIQGMFEGIQNNKVPGTFFRVAYDQLGRFGPKPVVNQFCVPQMSRYVRMFQSRRSLLIWKVFGQRLDGWKNEDFAIEKIPGDPASLHYKGKPFHGDSRYVGLPYTGSIMPPPAAVIAGKVKALTDEDRRMLVRWIDLGCPIDFDYDPARPRKRGIGWMADESRPTLTLTYPRDGVNPPLTRLLIGMHDYYSGLDPDSFRVVADFSLDGIAPGQNLAAKFKTKTDGVWGLKLARPLTRLAKGKLTVSIKDRQGNISRIERTFSVVTPNPAKR